MAPCIIKLDKSLVLGTRLEMHNVITTCENYLLCSKSVRLLEGDLFTNCTGHEIVQVSGTLAAADLGSIYRFPGSCSWKDIIVPINHLKCCQNVKVLSQKKALCSLTSVAANVFPPDAPRGLVLKKYYFII
eukprot:1159383-Pelagomonas_calceolata.AAC.3